MHCVNPLTAICLVDSVIAYKSRAAIQTAAASQLGRMVIRICAEKGLPLINIVRRQEQADMLKDLGCEHILNSGDTDFLPRLKELAKQLEAKVCLEAIGGEITG